MWGFNKKNNIVGGKIMVKKYERAFVTVIAFSEEVIAASGKMEDGEVLADWKSEWDKGEN